MSQLDLFGKSRDEQMYEMHVSGATHDEIAARFDIGGVRIYHEMTRILNDRCPNIDFSYRPGGWRSEVDA